MADKAAKDKPAENKPAGKSKVQVLWENSKSIISIIVIVLVIRSSFAAPYKIPTGSMIPSLEIGDHIFVSKLSYAFKLPIPFINYNLFVYDKPKIGDVVVFEYPEDPSIDFVKRVVGVPGDKIEVKDKKLYRNDKLVEIATTSNHNRTNRFGGEIESYKESLENLIHNIQFYKGIPSEDFGPIEVPENSYFVMGDNRDDSRDSRFWGFVPFKNLRGKAKLVWFSWNSETESIGEKIRIERLFKLIK